VDQLRRDASLHSSHPLHAAEDVPRLLRRAPLAKSPFSPANAHSHTRTPIPNISHSEFPKTQTQTRLYKRSSTPTFHNHCSYSSELVSLG
jgi:hypothetical protein